MKFLKWFWNGLRKVIGLVLPFWASARELRAWGPVWRWTVRLLFLAVVFVGFWLLQNLLVGDRYPEFLGKGLPELKPVWLPTFVVLVILFFWVGWWVWKLWTHDEEESPFPDIDEAWNEAVQGLERAGIGLGEAPLFLVLGCPAAGEQPVFKASRVEWRVDSAPEREKSPLRVYANRDAIFVTCSGASVVGHYASLLASGRAPAHDSAERGKDDARIYQSIADVNATLRPEGRAQLIKEILAEAERAKRELSDAEKQLLKYLGYAPDAARTSGTGGAAAALFRDAKEIERCTARLEHLCRLIVRDRRPYCPANGLLLLVPFAGTDEKNATRRLPRVRGTLPPSGRCFSFTFPPWRCFAIWKRRRGSWNS